jgi:hypothetical protein
MRQQVKPQPHRRYVELAVPNRKSNLFGIHFCYVQVLSVNLPSILIVYQGGRLVAPCCQQSSPMPNLALCRSCGMYAMN